MVLVLAEQEDAVAAGEVRAVALSMTRSRWAVAEAGLAAAAFAVLCIVVLRASPYLPEPDDVAYRASIVAMTHGHFFTLSGAQAHALAAQLAPRPGLVPPGGGPIQWVQLASGRWISEKDPGYPYLAVAFQTLGIIRLAPLFFGALACLGLYSGANRWLGTFGGAAAVGLYCSSGAAIEFAWRDYVPPHRRVANRSGYRSPAMGAARRRGEHQAQDLGWAGRLCRARGRYVRSVHRCRDARLRGHRGARGVALASRAASGERSHVITSVLVFCAGIATFDTLVYGGPLRSGYRPGEITFSLSAVSANLRFMPTHLIQAMPMLVLGFAALAGIILRWLRVRRAGGEHAATARRDLAVGLALAASWAAIWSLYATYTWTTAPGLSTLQSTRFYVPALGPIALLGAWLLVRVPRKQPLAAITTVAICATLFWLGARAFHNMYQFPWVDVHISHLVRTFHS